MLFTKSLTSTSSSDDFNKAKLSIKPLNTLPSIDENSPITKGSSFTRGGNEKSSTLVPIVASTPKSSITHHLNTI